MNRDLMEELLNEDESSSLDFKRDQYPFDGATDEQKGELLKDILAFADSWRRTDAYILIGVGDVKGGRGNPVGITHHLEDAKLQQFVNSKTQRPVSFSYEAFPFEGTQIGVIRIPIQDRPVYIKKDYGKLKKNIVYIRRGSSTDEAAPDEISNMGAATIKDRQEPILELQFADIGTRTGLGNSLNLVSEIIQLPPMDQIPDAGEFLDATTNRAYFREMAKYIETTSTVNKIGFSVVNMGVALATNVKLVIILDRNSNVILLDEWDYPSTPRISWLIDLSNLEERIDSAVIVEAHGSIWTLTTLFGDVQPKATVWSRGSFYVGAVEPFRLDLEGQIYADNLPEPIKVPLSIDITTSTRALSFKELGIPQNE